VPLTTWIHPELASLPVFVRAGAILPIAPLMQSTNEIPQGPLTLRVYSGDGCAGHLYLDDGKTYAYKTGVNLRMDFRCEVNADRLLLRLGEHKGSYPAWWREIRVEIFGWSPRGWSPRKRAVRLNGRNIDANLNLSPDKVAITVPDDGRGEVLEIE
jgi:alpha-glucosidase